MEKFVADRMLGKLTRYLRMLGYDVVYPEKEQDLHLIHIARKEGRILLTRDTHFSGRNDIVVLLIESDSVEEQLKQVVEELGLKSRSTNRCTLCNGELSEVDRREAKDYVPEYIYLSHEKFWVCRSCGHYYWPGSHWENIKAKLKI